MVGVQAVDCGFSSFVANHELATGAYLAFSLHSVMFCIILLHTFLSKTACSPSWRLLQLLWALLRVSELAFLLFLGVMVKMKVFQAESK